MFFQNTPCLMIITGVLFIFSAFIITEAKSSIGSTRSSYGETCNKTLRCKSQSWLVCDHESNSCQCSKPDDMIFDPIKEKCVTLIGERCKYGFDEDAGQNMWYEKADCVKGAVCGPSGICSCPTGFFEDVEGYQCTPVRGYGEACKSGIECNQNKFLTCVGGQCICDPDNAVYSNNGFESYNRNYGYKQRVPSGICIGRAGAQCSRNSEKYCIKNAECGSLDICQCTSGYAETSDRLCGLSHDQRCSNTDICSDKLRCAGYQDPSNQYQYLKCRCPNPSTEVYDTTKKICIGVVGSPCDPNAAACTTKASCIQSEDKHGNEAPGSLIFRCECDDGFVETEKDGKCRIAYSYPCEYVESRPPTDNSHLSCDQLANLQCKSGKCSCESDADIYEPERRQCSKAVGVRCSETEDCVKNSDCIKASKRNSWGRCICRLGFEGGRNQTCVPVGSSVEESEIILKIEDDEDFNLNSTTSNPNKFLNL